MVLKFDLNYIHIFESGETSLTIKRTDVCFLGSISKARYRVSCFRCSFTESEVKRNPNALLFQICQYKKRISYNAQNNNNNKKTKACYAWKSHFFD